MLKKKPEQACHTKASGNLPETFQNLPEPQGFQKWDQNGFVRFPETFWNCSVCAIGRLLIDLFLELLHGLLWAANTWATPLFR